MGKKNTYGKMRDKNRRLVQFSSSPRVMGTGIQAKTPSPSRVSSEGEAVGLWKEEWRK